MAGKPICPTPEELKVQIELLTQARSEAVGEDKMFYVRLLNSIYYLQTFLDNRRGYQKKQMVKRQILTKYMKEHPDLDQEIDQAVQARHRNVMEAESLDDVEDLIEGDDDAS
jgi:hypothetical protein